ncbi:hypothetical protein CANMA_000331 [Candida margitis]|uniref:uncharacterized protein n=1 Tax=Candida margitis TaxID=1775924 RepID=UPI0022262130|nr:uncharacterized protein CANMA_000331 [Candida margitis]KAI5970614.1 hypothetical protein CANMA_000331 [Candida margitis]
MSTTVMQQKLSKDDTDRFVTTLQHNEYPQVNTMTTTSNQQKLSKDVIDGYVTTLQQVMSNLEVFGDVTTLDGHFTFESWKQELTFLFKVYNLDHFVTYGVDGFEFDESTTVAHQRRLISLMENVVNAAVHTTVSAEIKKEAGLLFGRDRYLAVVSLYGEFSLTIAAQLLQKHATGSDKSYETMCQLFTNLFPKINSADLGGLSAMMNLPDNHWASIETAHRTKCLTNPATKFTFEQVRTYCRGLSIPWPSSFSFFGLLNYNESALYSSSSRTHSGFCNYCRKKGHIIEDCRKRKARQARDSNGFSSNSNHKSESAQFATSDPQAPSTGVSSTDYFC